MARRERGILLNESYILARTGKEVRTFFDCDKDYLEQLNVTPGDFISFSRGYGTDDAIDRTSASTSPMQ